MPPAAAPPKSAMAKKRKKNEKRNHMSSVSFFDESFAVTELVSPAKPPVVVAPTASSSSTASLKNAKKTVTPQEQTAGQQSASQPSTEGAEKKPQPDKAQKLNQSASSLPAVPPSPIPSRSGRPAPKKALPKIPRNSLRNNKQTVIHATKSHTKVPLSPKHSGSSANSRSTQSSNATLQSHNTGMKLDQSSSSLQSLQNKKKTKPNKKSSVSPQPLPTPPPLLPTISAGGSTVDTDTTDVFTEEIIDKQPSTSSINKEGSRRTSTQTTQAAQGVVSRIQQLLHDKDNDQDMMSSASTIGDGDGDSTYVNSVGTSSIMRIGGRNTIVLTDDDDSTIGVNSVTVSRSTQPQQRQLQQNNSLVKSPDKPPKPPKRIAAPKPVIIIDVDENVSGIHTINTINEVDVDELEEEYSKSQSAHSQPLPGPVEDHQLRMSHHSQNSSFNQSCSSVRQEELNKSHKSQNSHSSFNRSRNSVRQEDELNKSHKSQNSSFNRSRNSVRQEEELNKSHKSHNSSFNRSRNSVRQEEELNKSHKSQNSSFNRSRNSVRDEELNKSHKSHTSHSSFNRSHNSVRQEEELNKSHKSQNSSFNRSHKSQKEEDEDINSHNSSLNRSHNSSYNDSNSMFTPLVQVQEENDDEETGSALEMALAIVNKPSRSYANSDGTGSVASSFRSFSTHRSRAHLDENLEFLHPSVLEAAKLEKKAAESNDSEDLMTLAFGTDGKKNVQSCWGGMGGCALCILILLFWGGFIPYLVHRNGNLENAPTVFPLTPPPQAAPIDETLIPWTPAPSVTPGTPRPTTAPTPTADNTELLALLEGTPAPAPNIVEDSTSSNKPTSPPNTTEPTVAPSNITAAINETNTPVPEITTNPTIAPTVPITESPTIAPTAPPTEAINGTTFVVIPIEPEDDDDDDDEFDNLNGTTIVIIPILPEDLMDDTESPTQAPNTSTPTVQPSPLPSTSAPTEAPTVPPTVAPSPNLPTTSEPTGAPRPTTMPSVAPTSQPEVAFPEYTLGAFSNPASPQSKAFSWMLRDPNFGSYSPNRMRQRFALAVLYYSTDGDDWWTGNYTVNAVDRGGLFPWMSYSGHECDWYHQRNSDDFSSSDINRGTSSLLQQYTSNSLGVVVCGNEFDSSGVFRSYRQLWLEGVGLSGTLPPELAMLTALEQLHINHNHDLAGTLPGSWFLDDKEGKNSWQSTLLELQLKNNSLTGSVPPEVGFATNLEVLDLQQNVLRRSIPSTIGLLIGLQDLLWNDNQLSGRIPTELGMMTALKAVNLNSNRLSGRIPNEVVELRALQEFYVGLNFLSGSLPWQLGMLGESLEDVHVYSNRLTGAIPSELGLLTRLRWFHGGYNQLSGEIPSELGTMTLLQLFQVENNALEGPLPSDELAAWGMAARVWLDGNPELYGTIPFSWCGRNLDGSIELADGTVVALDDAVVPVSGHTVDIRVDCNSSLTCSCAIGCSCV